MIRQRGIAPPLRQPIIAQHLREQRRQLRCAGGVGGEVAHDFDGVGGAGAFAADGAEIDEPVAEDRLGHRLQRHIHLPVQFYLVVEGV